MTSRVMVTGSRSWGTMDNDRRRLNFWLRVKCLRTGATLIHGACPRGADKMADDWARANKHPVERYPADWDTHGKRAGFIRNAEMVALLGPDDTVLTFWDGESRGTLHAAKLARKRGLYVIDVGHSTEEVTA
jgi:hypothetical protein